jgi:hypothetical protein
MITVFMSGDRRQNTERETEKEQTVYLCRVPMYAALVRLLPDD